MEQIRILGKNLNHQLLGVRLSYFRFPYYVRNYYFPFLGGQISKISRNIYWPRLLLLLVLNPILYALDFKIFSYKQDNINNPSYCFESYDGWNPTFYWFCIFGFSLILGFNKILKPLVCCIQLLFNASRGFLIR